MSRRRASAGEAADTAFASAFGCGIDELAFDATDAALDSAWEVWEETLVAHLVAVEPRLSECVSVPADAHLAAASLLVDATGISGISIEAPPHADGADAGGASLSDAEQIQRLLTAATVRRRDHPWAAALSTVDEEVDGAAAPTVILADIGMLGAVGEKRLLGASGPVHAIHFGLGGPSLRAMAWHVHDHPHVMLTVADDLGIQLLSGQLAGLLGDRLILPLRLVAVAGGARRRAGLTARHRVLARVRRTAAAPHLRAPRVACPQWSAVPRAEVR